MGKRARKWGRSRRRKHRRGDIMKGFLAKLRQTEAMTMCFKWKASDRTYNKCRRPSKSDCTAPEKKKEEHTNPRSCRPWTKFLRAVLSIADAQYPHRKKENARFEFFSKTGPERVPLSRTRSKFSSDKAVCDSASSSLRSPS